MLQLFGVTKKFDSNTILENVNLLCDYGKIYGIIGRNGCGKSVLFKCICGLLQINEGKILLDGKDIIKSPNISKKIGIIIEEPAFLSRYSGLTNLKILYSINNKKDISNICHYMELVGLNLSEKKSM